MNLLKPYLLGFLSLILLYQCGGNGRRSNTNTGANRPVATTTPVNPDQEVGRWYQFFVVRTSQRVRQLPFALPGFDARAIFEEPEIRSFANNPPQGIDERERQALRNLVQRNPLGASRADDLFYNGTGQLNDTISPDILGRIPAQDEQNRQEAAARQWVINKLHLREAVSASVRQSFNTTLPPFPSTLASYVQSEFESLKNQLPDDQKALLAGWRTSVGSPPNASAGENLWSKQTSNVLWISPFLLRGLLLQSVQQPAEDEFDAVVADSSLTTRLLNNPVVHNAVVANFKSAIRYLLLHGMGHVVLAANPGPEREVEIDNFAFNRLGSKDVGSFLPFLDRAVPAAGANSTWGVEASGDGQRVSARIKSLQ